MKRFGREAPDLLGPRFCQALKRQGTETPTSQSCMAFPCRVLGPFTGPEGELRPRQELICPGRAASSADPGHLTHTLLPLPCDDSFPTPGCLRSLERESSLQWESEIAWECVPLCLGSHGRLPQPQASHCQRLPSIFCPPHLSANHEEKSLPISLS